MRLRTISYIPAVRVIASSWNHDGEDWAALLRGVAFRDMGGGLYQELLAAVNPVKTLRFLQDCRLQGDHWESSGIPSMGSF
jgi:hypothetical protein